MPQLATGLKKKSINPNNRNPDPERLLSAYFYSTTTLNYIRSLLASGYASLNHPREWSLSHVRNPALRFAFIISSRLSIELVC